MNIVEICKEQKQKLGYSYDRIAKEADLSPSTVSSFFRDSAKSPATRTAGPICRVLQVSMDAYYEITVPDMSAHEVNRVKTEHAALLKKYHDTKELADQALRDSLAAGEYIEQAERIAEMEKQKTTSAMKTITGLRNLSYILAAACALQGAAILLLLL